MGNVRMRAEQINYGASNVKVALDDLGPKDLIALSARMDTIEAWKATVKAEEKTGASVEYTNALALAAVSLSTEIEASQDLHGYDHPWVGGANVNKFDISNATMAGLISAFGLTVAKDSDGYITITGTYTGESGVPKFIIIPTLPVLADAVFYLMDKNTDANNNVIQCRWANAETGGVAIDLQNMVQNQTYNIKFHLMIVTDGTVPTSYRPYSNISPISGRTSVTITDYDSESNTATVTVQLGQTVYGGTLNVTTGVLTVTDASVTLDGSSDEVWDVSANRFRCRPLPANCKDSSSTVNGVSNLYEAKTADNLFGNRQTPNYVGFAVSNTELLVVDNVNFATDDLSAYKTYLANNNLQVVYKLATPTTIQLTPTQLTMLKGYNRLSSDGGGDITVKAYTGAPWGGDEA